jgi:16S rRNA (guanine527-N7)-methyltransferase
MPIISEEFIDKTLEEYQVFTTPAIRAGIQRYISLLLRWNKRISLTAITDPLQILRFHFGESMFAASSVPIRDGRLADVGSGAGFPGLPLRIMVPHLDLVLIESNSKKASFLSECVRELDLDGIEVIRSRFQDLDQSDLDFDFITARALGGYEGLIQWGQKRLASSGAMVLWLGQDDAIKLKNESSIEWRSPTAIPASDHRVILVGTRK